MLREPFERAKGATLVVGIGNELKADDGAGPTVIARLRERHPSSVMDAGQAPENYVAPIRRAEPRLVVLVDAADFGGRPGEMRTAVADDVHGLMMGTHAAPLSMFMRVLAEETGAEVRLVAIQVKATELGGPMSPEVAAAVDELVNELDGLLD